ncbi:MAG: glycosyltransferase [Verrucomicrobia bacterium]|nr:glycosyltransferase [Verrucomicrobiota bacterium]
MKFSIITPSFRSSQWLKLCVASVADQGVEVEHIVQDAGSDDGTLDWLPRDPRVKLFVGRDAGMYDGINRGLRRATGDVLAYLNCDEQYLPGALAAVGDFFQRHPDIEVAMGDTVFVDGEGRYLCHRRAVLPGRYHTWVSDTMAAASCAVFFRRSVVERHGLFFDPGLRILGDVVWMLQLIERRVPMGLVGGFTSAFTCTGQNLALSPDRQRERAALMARAPAWARCGRPLIVAHYRLRKWLAGHYGRGALDYSIFTTASPVARVAVHVARPSVRFRMEPLAGD